MILNRKEKAQNKNKFIRYDDEDSSGMKRMYFLEKTSRIRSKATHTHTHTHTHTS